MENEGDSDTNHIWSIGNSLQEPSKEDEIEIRE